MRKKEHLLIFNQARNSIFGRLYSSSIYAIIGTFLAAPSGKAERADYLISKLLTIKTLNKTTFFLLFTFGISFLVAAIYKLLGGTGTGTVGFTLLGAFYMFIPTISVLIVEKLIHKE